MAMGLEPDQNSITLKIMTSPKAKRPYTGIIFIPQNNKLFTNLLSLTPSFHCFNPTTALKEPKQLPSNNDSDNAVQKNSFLIILNFRSYQPSVSNNY